MAIERPTEYAQGPIAVTSTTPADNPGKLDMLLDGAMGAIFECTAATSGTGTVEVQSKQDGTWRAWPCFEYAVGAGTFTLRAAGATITLAAADILFIPCAGFHAVRWSLAGTSTTLVSRTCEDLTSVIQGFIGAAATISGTVAVAGDVAHDAADSGNPVKIGAKAVAMGATPTAVTADDRTNLLATRSGQLWTLGGHPNSTRINVRVLDSDGAQSNIAMVTVSSGTRIIVTECSATMDGSNTGPINAAMGFAAATLATPNTTSGAGILIDFLGIPAGGGITKGNGGGNIGFGADGEDLRYTTEDPAGGAACLGATYYTEAV